MVLKLLVNITIVAIISFAVLLFPVVRAQDGIGQITVATAMATLVTEMGAIGFFLASLHAFKKKLRTAYSLVAIGILTYALFVVPSLVAGFNISMNAIAQSSLTLTPFAFGAVITFLGIRMFARQLGIRYVWSSVWFVALLAGLLALTMAFVSSSPYPELPDEVFRVLIGLVGWSVGFNVASAILAIRIRHMIGVFYKTAMLWLTCALCMLAFINLHELAVKTNDVVLKSMPDYFATYAFWYGLFVAIFFLGAGMAFREISKKLSVLPDNASYIDVITYVAQLISNPTAIDATLDKVRQITAKGGSALSPSDKKVLLEVYSELEKYVTGKEPIVKISKEELRLRLPESFQSDLARAGQKAAVK